MKKVDWLFVLCVLFLPITIWIMPAKLLLAYPSQLVKCRMMEWLLRVFPSSQWAKQKIVYSKPWLDDVAYTHAKRDENGGWRGLPEPKLLVGWVNATKGIGPSYLFPARKG